MTWRGKAQTYLGLSDTLAWKGKEAVRGSSATRRCAAA